jgi:hypothetical protein
MADRSETTTAPKDPVTGEINLAEGADREIRTSNQRDFSGTEGLFVVALCIAYTMFHVGIMNLYPLETWTYRLIHVGGGLALGFLLFSAYALDPTQPPARTSAAVRKPRRSASPPWASARGFSGCCGCGPTGI